MKSAPVFTATAPKTGWLLGKISRPRSVWNGGLDAILEFGILTGREATPAQPPAQPPATRRRPLPALRLSTLLLSVSLVIAVFANLATVRQLRRAERELREFRREFGYLAISNPAEIAAVRVPTAEPLLWQYRVYVPAGDRYRFAYGCDWKADASSPRWLSALAIPQGRSVVTVRVLQDPRDSVWKLEASLRQERTTVRQATPLTDDQRERFLRVGDTFQMGLGLETQTARAGQDLMLVDQRWIDAESGQLLFGNRAPKTDTVGIFGMLEPDEGALND